MDVDVGPLTLLKLGTQLVTHKVLQHRLGTGETVIKETKNGKVKGLKRRTVYDETYYAFEGIPYALPPLGDLRFKAPQPMGKWNEVKDCTKTASKPMQKHMVLKIIEGSEDCLYLNIYSKNLDSPNTLPVMVWIYGGGFAIGEATRDFYSPDYFMEKNVVLVTINYRLGAFGFLSLNDRDLDVPGNAGLKDQLLALKWVKENINNFNGNPNNITLFGESAGGCSTHILMMTEKSEGLFHKAIIQSGSNYCEWAHEPTRNWGFRLAEKCGYKGAPNDKDVFEFIKTLDSKTITIYQASLLTEEELRQYILFAFAPVIEPYESSHSVMIKPPYELAKNAWSNRIPIIVGGTSFEGLFSYQLPKKHRYLIDDVSDCLDFVPNEVRKLHSNEELKQMGLKIKELYFNNQEPSLKETLMPYLDLMTYKIFWHGLHRLVMSRLAYASGAPTYLYRFDFDSPFFNHYRIIKCGPTMRGVSHADDISYLFYHISSKTLPKNSPEYQTIKRMVGMWVAFAKSSDPNINEIKPAIWEPLKNSENRIWQCLNISNNVEFKDLPESSKLTLWDSFYTKAILF